MGQLTTHVLDVTNGQPAEGMVIELYRLDTNAAPTLLLKTVTNKDGRCSAPLLNSETLISGEYELRFGVAAYFRNRGCVDAGEFLGIVPVVFRVKNPKEHYHVPLLVTPWSYSTYRGS